MEPVCDLADTDAPNGNSNDNGCSTPCWGDPSGTERCGGATAASVWALVTTEELQCVQGEGSTSDNLVSAWAALSGSLVCEPDCTAITPQLASGMTFNFTSHKTATVSVACFGLSSQVFPAPA